MGEKLENEITVNSVEDVKFHLPLERSKLTEGVRLAVGALSDLEAALQSGEGAAIGLANKSVGEYLMNLNSSGANVKALVDFVEKQSTKEKE